MNGTEWLSQCEKALDNHMRRTSDYARIDKTFKFT
jgi:hypothetical protein